MYAVQDTGIPPPRTNQNKYPWHQLTPGKSFLVPIDDPAFHHMRHTVKTRMLRYPGLEYTCRVAYDETGAKIGMRVTLVKVPAKPAGKTNRR